MFWGDDCMRPSRQIYMDHAATTPVHPAVVEAMRPYFADRFGNPSSLHLFGREAKDTLETAREKVAALIGATPGEIVFTSGGTESDNFALVGAARANERRGRHVVTSVIEHHAVLETCVFLEELGFNVTRVPVDRDGFVDPDDVERALRPDTVLVSIMASNNEIGTLEPVAEIGVRLKERSIPFHCDAVQSAGAVSVNVEEMNADLLSLSAHKLYGPKGVGALYIRRGTRMKPLLHGGEQERARRAGTENLPGIVGFGVACEVARGDLTQTSHYVGQLRDRLIDGLTAAVEAVALNGHRTQRLPGNVNVSIKGCEGESLVLNLDLVGVAASTGSACSSGSLSPSHVLKALGLPQELEQSAIRLTLGRTNTEEEVDAVLEELPRIVSRLRSLGHHA